ncbi:hypothetical protein [Haloarchaeobius sp. HRN-SO-5]|uniref:hypothetical protein n=1 Tax=Haloarchaeobius sp. HRN-SO-5 TaxID=3446118 RepID=UPI003EB8E61F
MRADEGALAEETADAATGDVAFTFDWYGDFLDRLCDHGRRFRDYEADLRAGDVVLRHDVDWSPERALRTARMEADRGISATYFFLVSSPFYNVVHKPNRRILEHLESLGHDVGLHFSTHQYWSEEPPESELVARVADERAILTGAGADPVDAVSFHRPPEWVFRRSFQAFDSTYEERFFTDIAYRGDSNQRWREDPPLAGGVPEKMQVLTHPGLWGDQDATFDERLDALCTRTLGRTHRFMHDQFVEKKYNIDEYCEVGPSTVASSSPSR